MNFSLVHYGHVWIVSPIKIYKFSNCTRAFGFHFERN